MTQGHRPVIVLALSDIFFIASKILGGLIRPESIFMLLMAWGLIRLRSHPRSAGRLLALELFALVAIAALPLGYIVLKPLESRFPANPQIKDVNGIIILGGGADPVMSARTGVPELTEAADRYTAAVTLARRFPKALVVFTGGNGNLVGRKDSEANVAKRILTDLGVEPNRLGFESSSRTTAENAALLRARWNHQSQGTWLLVTSASHMPRAMGSFCAAGWTNLVPWPVDYHAGVFSDGVGWNLEGHLSDLNTGLKEWEGLTAYYFTGRSTSLFPINCAVSHLSSKNS